ncbi:MAG: protein disulfide isomerase family protein [bacterium]
MKKNILITATLILVGIGVLFVLQGKITDRTGQVGLESRVESVTGQQPNGSENLANASHALDSFAQCLTEKGAKLYGASWCPHCQNQKAKFEASVEFVPYVECATKDGQGQAQECTQNGIKGYPTWKFVDGSEKVGETSLQELAKTTGCLLPESY